MKTMPRLSRLLGIRLAVTTVLLKKSSGAASGSSASAMPPGSGSLRMDCT